MSRKIFKIIERKNDCVLMCKDSNEGGLYRTMWQVRDIENDIIYMGFDYHKAKDAFDKYDLEKVRADRKKVFEDWLFEYAE